MPFYLKAFAYIFIFLFLILLGTNNSFAYVTNQAPVAAVGQPDFNSENEVFFSYIYKHPNKLVKIEEIEATHGEKLKKTIHQVLRDLGFSGNIKKIFFKASKNGVVFTNPVDNSHLKSLDIPYIKIKDSSEK